MKNKCGFPQSPVDGISDGKELNVYTSVSEARMIFFDTWRRTSTCRNRKWGGKPVNLKHEENKGGNYSLKKVVLIKVQ